MRRPRRTEAPPVAPAPWALLSFLLRYPGPEVAGARDELAAEVSALPGGPARAALERFLAGWTGDQTALAARYVETFDLRRRASLHLTYYAHGDTRERGMALLRLKKLYRAAGLPLDSAELPDHLTVMLAFAALAPAGHGEALLAVHRPAIELLRLSLHDLESPYAHLLDAIAAGLPPLSVTDRGEVARGPARRGGRARALRPAGGDAERRAHMSAGEILLWIIFPYAAVTTFAVGTWWRYRADQFGWTSGSTQLFEQKILGWAGPAFHYGALAAVGGHIVGLMIPKSFTAAVGMSESTYRWFSAIAGAVAGAICVVGFVGLVYRRITNVRVRRTTSRTDLLVYLLLVVLIGLGCWMTFVHNLITASPYDYRDSVSEWWRSLLILQPDVEAVQGASTVYQVHAIIAWAFWALFPFSRLVHAWSIPLQYLGRPYILYRRRYATTSTRSR